MVNLFQGRGSGDDGQNKDGDVWVCCVDLEWFNQSGSEVVWREVSCKLGWSQIAEGFKSLEKELNFFKKLTIVEVFKLIQKWA